MEADGLQWSLLIIGSLVIVGIAVHGIWLSRKNNESTTSIGRHKKDQEYQPSGWESDNDVYDDVEDSTNYNIDENVDMNFDTGEDKVVSKSTDSKSQENNYDDLGLGTVRVVSGESKVDAEQEQSPPEDILVEPEISSSKIYASVVTRPKPEYAAKYDSLVSATGAISKQEKATSNKPYRSHDHYQAPEPPPFLLKKQVSQPEDNSEQVEVNKQTKASQSLGDEQKDTEANSNPVEKLSLSEQSRHVLKHKKVEWGNERLEPKYTNDQMGIDFDNIDEEPSTTEEPQKEPIQGSKTEPVQPEQPQEVLVLNVKSADDNLIPGSALLPMLLTLGFKFGEQDIFHRHIQSNGKGPVLFSLANMFKPGNFDIDNLENFTTGGISLFMILPIEGEPHQVFNMMHNAARKIADEFSAQIYDGRRVLLTKQSLQQYVEKIREFERKRILRG
jgi:cell division protein ZipA